MVIVKNTLGGGRKNGVVTAWGHAVGIGGYALLTMLGLVVVVQGYPVLFRGISSAGALYLGWLGWKSLCSKGGIATALAGGEKQGLAVSARDGLLIAVLNPKVGLFFLAIFSQVMRADVGFFGHVVTVLTPLCIDGCWYTFVVLMLARNKRLERLQSIVLSRLIGSILLLLALRIILTG